MYFFFNYLISPVVCRRNLLSGVGKFFCSWKTIFTHFPMYMWEKLITMTCNYIHAISFSNSNTPFMLFTRKNFTSIMWASHFVRNGNKLSISSWLTTEIQVCQNVGLPNSRPMNLVFLLFPPIHSWIRILCNNRQPQPRLLIWSQTHYNRNRGFKNTVSEARTATAVFWKLTTDPSLVWNRMWQHAAGSTVSWLFS